MNIGPHTSISHNAHLSSVQSSEARATGGPSKLHQAGHFLSRSVKSLGSSLKSGFVSTYNWAKKTGSKLLGDTTPLSPEEKAALAAEKQKDTDYSRNMINKSFNL